MEEGDDGGGFLEVLHTVGWKRLNIARLLLIRETYHWIKRQEGHSSRQGCCFLLTAVRAKRTGREVNSECTLRVLAKNFKNRAMAMSSRSN